MAFRGREEGIVVSITSGKVWDHESGKRIGAVNAVVFFLRRPCVVGLEIRKVGCSMARQTIADLARGELGGWSGQRSRLRQEHL